MIGYICLITDTTNNMKYTGKHHYDKEGELDSNYHGSGVIISRIYKERPETHSEETKKKLSDAHKGKHLSDEHKKKLSESMSGENNPFYGRQHSDEKRNELR